MHSVQFTVVCKQLSTQYDAHSSIHCTTHTVQYIVRRKHCSTQFDAHSSVHITTHTCVCMCTCLCLRVYVCQYVCQNLKQREREGVEGGGGREGGRERASKRERQRMRVIERRQTETEKENALIKTAIFVISLTQFFVFLSLYVTFNILHSIYVCSTASL